MLVAVGWVDDMGVSLSGRCFMNGEASSVRYARLRMSNSSSKQNAAALLSIYYGPAVRLSIKSLPVTADGVKLH